ncbi:hypothetical protein GF391_00080 [Candidatus Uhrbacteria bacterium]|nr:hypothetical protein [Candidatus Uhrbacteria bacterium]
MSKSQQKIIGLSAALLLVIVITLTVGITIYGIYTEQNDGTASRFVAKALALPAASVEGRKVAYTRFLLTRDAVKRFINSEAGQDVGAAMPPEDQLNQNILEQLIRQQMVAAIAAQKQVTLSDEEVDEVFNEVASQAASSTQSDIDTYLRDNYGWNQDNFREYVLRPALLEQKLAQQLSTGSNPVALENLLITKRQSEDVVVYLKFSDDSQSTAPSE